MSLNRLPVRPLSKFRQRGVMDHLTERVFFEVSAETGGRSDRSTS